MLIKGTPFVIFGRVDYDYNWWDNDVFATDSEETSLY